MLQGRAFRDLTDCQAVFDRWRDVYNTQRPHEGLGLAVPATRYRVRPRPYPEQLPALGYDAAGVVRRVQTDGTVGFRGRWWRVGKPFIGEWVAARPTATDGVWAVYFGVHPVAEIDQRGGSEGSRTVTHVPEHPLPMSPV